MAIDVSRTIDAVTRTLSRRDVGGPPAPPRTPPRCAATGCPPR